MKVLIIKLAEEDIDSITYLTETIGKMIEDGYTSGMGSPVDWSISETKDFNDGLRSLQNQVRNLRDSDEHCCPADKDNNNTCDCYKYDAIIDSLENKMYNE